MKKIIEHVQYQYLHVHVWIYTYHTCGKHVKREMTTLYIHRIMHTHKTIWLDLISIYTHTHIWKNSHQNARGESCLLGVKFGNHLYFLFHSFCLFYVGINLRIREEMFYFLLYLVHYFVLITLKQHIHFLASFSGNLYVSNSDT